ncbi:ester cyclase [Kitasatospora sp. NPDC004614]|uniref:ester cyclase n=1 Tax=unclassified Kitasatospora TaxID=2633591 RepID=UPI0036C90738
MTDLALDPRSEPAEASRAVLWSRWMDLWNGDREIGRRILAPELTLHLPEVGMPPAASIRTPEDFVNWIALFRGSFREDARIRTTLGPFSCGDYLMARWEYRGVWTGGRPATATAPPGTGITLRGADIVRLDAQGRIAEYWLSDDLLDMYAQLGAETPRKG